MLHSCLCGLRLRGAFLAWLPILGPFPSPRTARRHGIRRAESFSALLGIQRGPSGTSCVAAYVATAHGWMFSWVSQIFFIVSCTFLLTIQCHVLYC